MSRGTLLSILCLIVVPGCGGAGGTVSVLDVESESEGPPLAAKQGTTGVEGLGKDIAHGDVKLRVDSVEVRPVNMQPRAGEGAFAMTDERYLVVALTLTNVGEKQKLEYTGWGSFAAELNGNPPKLTDEQGRLYRLMTFGQDAVVEGRLNSANLVRDQPKRDVLVFAAPPDDVRVVYLTLPGENIGAKESIRLRLPLKR